MKVFVVEEFPTSRTIAVAFQSAPLIFLNEEIQALTTQSVGGFTTSLVTSGIVTSGLSLTSGQLENQRSESGNDNKSGSNSSVTLAASIAVAVIVVIIIIGVVIVVVVYKSMKKEPRTHNSVEMTSPPPKQKKTSKKAKEQTIYADPKSLGLSGDATYASSENLVL